MRDVVFARAGWIPKVVRDDGALLLELGAGADANHDPRTFTFPIDDAHLTVIRDDLRRHLLLWSAVLPLCDAAGTRGPLDEDAAVALLDPILFAAPADIDALFRRVRWSRGQLIAHGADLGPLDRGEIWAAMGSATETADTTRVQEYDASRRRAQRGVTLGPLDAALLKFTGRYLHGATIPKRRPEAVEPALLSDVLRVIATAERASAGLRISRDPRRGGRATDKGDWDRMAATIDAAVRDAHPELVDDAVATVSFLLCSEAAGRARSQPIEDDGGVAERPLIFTDDKDGEETWRPGDRRTATAEFWEFVEGRSAADNEVFTIEDEEKGEGLQLHFYADSIARIMTIAGGGHRVEYILVDGLEGYRTLVRAFVTGGYAALDGHGPWLTNVDDFEQARRQRNASNR